jgi:hypothetical protein
VHGWVSFIVGYTLGLSSGFVLLYYCVFKPSLECARRESSRFMRESSELNRKFQAELMRAFESTLAERRRE